MVFPKGLEDVIIVRGPNLFYYEESLQEQQRLTPVVQEAIDRAFAVKEGKFPNEDTERSFRSIAYIAGGLTGM